MSSAPQVPGAEVRGQWRDGCDQVRRVELTGPTDRRTAGDALDRGAEVFTAPLPAYERLEVAAA